MTDDEHDKALAAVLDTSRDLLMAAFEAGVDPDEDAATDRLFSALLDASTDGIKATGLHPSRWWCYIAQALCSAYQSGLRADTNDTTDELFVFAAVDDTDGAVRLIEDLDAETGDGDEGRGAATGLRLLSTYLNRDKDTWGALWEAVTPRHSEDTRYVYAVFTILLQAGRVIVGRAAAEGLLTAEQRAYVEQHPYHRVGPQGAGSAADAATSQLASQLGLDVKSARRLEVDPRDASPDDQHLSGDGPGFYLYAIYDGLQVTRVDALDLTHTALANLAAARDTATCGTVHNLDVTIDGLPHTARSDAAAALADAERTIGRNCHIVRVWTHFAGCCPDQNPTPAPEEP